MQIFLTILKWASQALIAVGAFVGVWRTQTTKDNNGKWSITNLGIVSIATIIINLALFVFGDISQRKEIRELRLNRDLAGIEISFTPSDEDWSRIEAALNKIPPQVKEIPFSAATIRAERSADNCGDNWKINFDPVSRPEGTVKFRSISSTDPTAKAFADVIQQASPSLWIKWGSNVTTEIEPRANQHASAITISRNLITINLRSPKLKLKLNELDDDGFAVLIRASRQPPKLWIKSFDDGITLDQTLDMNWKEEAESSPGDPDDYLKRTKPYVSGPHKLQIKMKS